jgi:hypothetical protein
MENNRRLFIPPPKKNTQKHYNYSVVIEILTLNQFFYSGLHQTHNTVTSAMQYLDPSSTTHNKPIRETSQLFFYV